MSARRAAARIPLEAANTNAVGLLQEILNDSLRVMRDNSADPHWRLWAQRQAANIIAWNTNHGPLKYTFADVTDVSDKIRVTPE